MSEEIENEENETEDKSNLIGVDPLAWLSDEEKSSLLNKLQDSDDGDVTSEVETSVENNIEENIEKVEPAEVVKDVNEEGDSFLINLESSVTIRNITELLDQLNNIDSNENNLIIDCSQIEKTDAAAMQLLTGYYLFAKEEGKNIVWDNPSDAFCNAVSILGLNDIINIPSVAA